MATAKAVVLAPGLLDSGAFLHGGASPGEAANRVRFLTLGSRTKGGYYYGYGGGKQEGRYGRHQRYAVDRRSAGLDHHLHGDHAAHAQGPGRPGASAQSEYTEKRRSHQPYR